MKKTQPQPIAKPQLPNKDALFWSYAEYDPKLIKELETYLFTFITQNQQSKGSIQEQYQTICKHLDIPTHPQIKIKIKPQMSANNLPQQFLQESIDSIRHTQDQIQILSIQNTLLDSITLTILQIIWPQFPLLNVLKLYNVVLKQQEIEIIEKIIQDNKIIKLFIEYVNIVPKINNNNLTQLYLRGNQINQETLQQLLQPNKLAQLISLELSDNPIQKEGIMTLSEYLSRKNQIQYLGLSKIEINSWDELKPLLSQIGPEKLNEQKLQSYRDLEEKRERQLKEQMKAKKKEIFADIELEPLIQNSDGTYSIIHNQQLQILYFALNPFKDSDRDQIEKFLVINPQIQVILQGSQMENKTKEKIKKKFSNAIF